MGFFSQSMSSQPAFKISTVVRNKLHLHTVLFLILMVRHDGGVRDVNPVVVLAINPTTIHCLGRVSPPKHISVRVPFELCIVAGDDIRWIDAKIGQITASGPVPVCTSSRVSSGIVQGCRRKAAEKLKYLQLNCF